MGAHCQRRAWSIARSLLAQLVLSRWRALVLLWLLLHLRPLSTPLHSPPRVKAETWRVQPRRESRVKYLLMGPKWSFRGMRQLQPIIQLTITRGFVTTTRAGCGHQVNFTARCGADREHGRLNTTEKRQRRSRQPQTLAQVAAGGRHLVFGPQVGNRMSGYELDSRCNSLGVRQLEWTG